MSVISKKKTGNLTCENINLYIQLVIIYFLSKSCMTVVWNHSLHIHVHVHTCIWRLKSKKWYLKVISRYHINIFMISTCRTSQYCQEAEVVTEVLQNWWYYTVKIRYNSIHTKSMHNSYMYMYSKYYNTLSVFSILLIARSTTHFITIWID